MKYFYYILFSISILTVSCSRNTITLTEEELPEDVFYPDNSIVPFSGVCLVYYNNSEVLKEELHFKDGIQEGLHISYYKSGIIKRKGYYKDGFMSGTWIMFNEYGDRLYVVNYQNDTLTGTYRSWYPTGVPCIKGTYSKNKRIGEWIHYNEAGMVLNTEDL